MHYFTKKAKKDLALFILFTLATTIALLSCTDNTNAKDYGGSASITLPENQKLINVTWKDADLWYITRPMIFTDTACVYTFQEKSQYGIWNGTYIITEVKNMPVQTPEKRVNYDSLLFREQ